MMPVEISPLFIAEKKKSFFIIIPFQLPFFLLVLVTSLKAKRPLANFSSRSPREQVHLIKIIIFCCCCCCRCSKIKGSNNLITLNSSSLAELFLPGSELAHLLRHFVSPPPLLLLVVILKEAASIYVGRAEACRCGVEIERGGKILFTAYRPD